MTSMFDSAVYQRRKHTPWARMSLLAFARDVIFNEPDLGDVPRKSIPQNVQLTISPRKDVASGVWYELEWVGCDSQRHCVASQEYDLCLFRATEVEIMAREKMEQNNDSRRSP